MESKAPITLPRVIEEVTAAWLSEALRQQRPGIEVASLEVLKNMGGACTKLRVRVTTNDPAFPETVIVKGCFEPHTAAMRPVQFVEAMSYARVVPLLEGVETVRCFFVQADQEMGSALVMEDLDRRGAICLNALEPIESYELAADFLGNLARLHARWWNSPDLLDESRFGFVGQANEARIDYADRSLGDPAAFAELKCKPRAACLSRTILDGPRLLRAFGKVKELGRGMSFTLLHGDMHPSNLFATADGRGGLLDWLARRGNWAGDVSYFLGGNLDPVDRRAWERPLLQSYLSSLAAHGAPAPAFEDAWFAYRIWMMWGIYVWLTNIPEYHSEDKITAMASRYGAALVDHGTLDLLDPRP